MNVVRSMRDSAMQFEGGDAARSGASILLRLVFVYLCSHPNSSKLKWLFFQIMEY